LDEGNYKVVGGNLKKTILEHFNRVKSQNLGSGCGPALVEVAGARNVSCHLALSRSLTSSVEQIRRCAHDKLVSVM
jgi:hypothetical protein